MDWIRIASFGIWAVYEPVATATGETVGNRLKEYGLRKQKKADQKIYLLQALPHYLIKMALGWLSYLTIHTNEEKGPSTTLPPES